MQCAPPVTTLCNFSTLKHLHAREFMVPGKEAVGEEVELPLEATQPDMPAAGIAAEGGIDYKPSAGPEEGSKEAAADRGIEPGGTGWGFAEGIVPEQRAGTGWPVAAEIAGLA